MEWGGGVREGDHKLTAGNTSPWRGALQVLIVVSLCCSASSVVDVVSVVVVAVGVVVAVAVVAAFLQPFRGAVSFCLSTFLMPQKEKSNSLTPRLPHAAHKLATSLLSLSLTLCISPLSLSLPLFAI